MDELDDTEAHGALLERLRRFGAQPVDGARRSADLTAMATARPRSAMRSKLRLAGALLAGLLIGSTGLAAADALPDPAQHVAHTVLDRVGVQVPDPERYHGPECGAEAKRNHGAYVRDDHTLAKSDCGKKTKAADVHDESDDPSSVKGPCAGKPPWAEDKSLTPEDKATAQAERAASCGSDDEAPEEVDAGDRPDSTPTVESTVTTESPTTTLAESSTTTT